MWNLTISITAPTWVCEIIFVKIKDQKFLMKKERFPLGTYVPVENVKTLKPWLWVFSATHNLKNLTLHHNDIDPDMSLLDDFSQNRRPKFISEKRAIFPRRRTGKTCETLKTWLWVFSSIDDLRNVKLHHIDYGPNMSLWDYFSKNRRSKFISE